MNSSGVVSQYYQMKMMSNKIKFPKLLAKASRLKYIYEDEYGINEYGIDFEPFHDFLSADETDQWFQHWTGNPDADSSNFCIFGQDGTGGYAAFWTVRPNAHVLEQPVVFMGSEGETVVVARNFYDYLWLLAEGLGPCEVAYFSEEPEIASRRLAKFAKKHAGPARSIHKIMKNAKREFPNFQQFIDSQCR